MKKLFAFLAILLFASPAFAAFQITGYTVPATGAPAPYWVISKIDLNYPPTTVKVTVNGYISSAAYIAGNQPVNTQNFNITGATYTAFLAGLTAADIPSGSAQSAVLMEMIGALQTNMLTLPFFST